MRTNAQPRQIPTDPDALLSETEVSDLFGISIRTLQAWRPKKGKPPFVKLGRIIRYRRKDLIKWLEASMHTPA